MRLPNQSETGVAFPAARLLRIAAAGLLCAVLVFLIGRISERIVLGSDTAAARIRAEADVRAAFDRMARSLQAIVTPLAEAAVVTAAAQDDLDASRQLFDRATAAVAAAGDDGAFAVTVYGADGRALAWSGRPSELPVDRIQGGAAWFFTRGALGLRLVHVLPVAAGGGERAGAVAAERAFTNLPAPLPDSDVFVFAGRIAPASIQLTDTVGAAADGTSVDVTAPTGERLLTARIAEADLISARARWRRATASIALIVLAIAAALLVGPLLDWRNRLVRTWSYARALALLALAVVGARVLLRLASPADWLPSPVFSGVDYASALAAPFLASPFDFLMTAAAAGSLVALLLAAVDAWRTSGWHRRRDLPEPAALFAYAAAQLLAGIAVAAILIAHYALLRDTLASTSLDLLHFSLHPWVTTRLAMQVGLVIWHAAVVGLAAVVLRAATARWRVPRSSAAIVALTIALWAAPLLAWQLWPRGGTRTLPLLVALGAVIALVLVGGRLKARYRHGSQAFRLIMATFGLVVPAVVFYPSVFQLGWQTKAQLVETRYAPQALNQRTTVLQLLQESLDAIDRVPALVRLVSAPAAAGDPPGLPDRAFQVWRLTGLAESLVTSSVELHAPDGRLVSRFAFNLPEDPAIVARSDEESCTWGGVYEEVSPFFGEDRRVLHAGRAVCDDAGARVGSIVVHAIMSDYSNLSFIASQNPYVELMRPADELRGEGAAGRDIEFAFYGWSRTPLYASGVRAWTLTDPVFARVQESRDPVWAQLERGDEEYDVHISNDRGGIYALGFPVVTPLEHLVNLAEVTVLAWGTCVLLLAIGAVFGTFSRRGTTARALLREVRASFFRKLLLAFILATVVPVVALAIATRTYVADELTANVEEEAVRTASAARRVVEDLVAPNAPQEGVVVDDNLMVWVSRLVDQDVNIFRGPQLLATSERNLFASGVLPTRTPDDIYRALQLENEAAAVTREQIGAFGFLVAATAITAPQLDAMLTVPLTSRQQEIEAQIDTLDRRVLLGALLFVFGGAGIGYWLAERIADPVNRLTRATRRIARGDLDARIAATSSDELRRLVQDFNRMAGELQRQQKELERTHRLEAWAEMARQVAHEIKNPLTPIQLNAEHLRRVHADRGEPLSPVLEECVSTILSQVRLLRQIASEFSSFASSPTARLAAVDVAPLLRDLIDPYRLGLGDRIRFDVAVPASLPPVHVDRTLISRALTNLVENALHAMPGAGTLSVHAGAADGVVRIRVADTGVGMDAEALARAFEPYFSTKATGTGLGLPIAKRNVELSGGTISVASERDKGTTVELTLPVIDKNTKTV